MTLTDAPARPVTGSPPDRFRSADSAAYPQASSREEEWRFTPLAKFRVLLDGGPSDAVLTWDSVLPDGVELLTLPADAPELAQLPLPADRLSALARERSPAVTVLRIAKGAEPVEPVAVRLSGTGSADVVWTHLVIDAGEQSSAAVVIEYTGSARFAAETSVLVGDGARLNLVQVQDWAADTVHGEHVGARVGRDATLTHTAVGLGGGVVRIVPTVEFAGSGATARMYGVGFAGDGQHLESRLFVDHSVPECTSDVVYKNVLTGQRTRTVWIGDVRIRPSATGTRTFELNRNLLLSGGARADSVPNLEIETGQIAGAGHASATGRFDDLQLFYLQARGIPEAEARRLVVRGFLAEVIHRIGLPELEQRLVAAIEHRLGAAPATAGARADVLHDVHDDDKANELENA
ncbi:MAG: Fe-S cluster assembly protein SufD [bacterium]